MQIFWKCLLLDLQSSASRKYEVLSILLCSACLALVILVFSSLRSGLSGMLQSAGSDQVVIVLGNGAESEVISSFNSSQLESLRTAVKADFGTDISLSAELFTNIRAGIGAEGEAQIVGVRGISSIAFDQQRQVKVLTGRMFQPGKRELLVGKALAARNPWLQLEQKIALGSLQWTVVGIFSSAENVAESEVWGDVQLLQDAYNRPGIVNSIRLGTPDANTALQLALHLNKNSDHTSVRARTQREYYSRQIDEMTGFTDIIAIPSIAILLLATGFSALQSMHTMMEARRRETAVLRAIGFPAATLSFSVFSLAMLLSIAGAICGVLCALLLFSQVKAVVMNHASLSEIVFPFAVTPTGLGYCALATLAIALIGGLPAALLTLRLQICNAIRKQ